MLQRRFPHLELPKKEDICYATTNRQAAVRALARECELILVVGSGTSSNSNRLREVAEACGVRSHLLMTPDEVDPAWASEYRSIGVTSGASTPEGLVEDVVGALLDGRSNVSVTVLETVIEDVSFRPARSLIELAMARS